MPINKDIYREQPLVGLKVQVVIEEDGTRNPPSLPRGTIVRVFRERSESAYCIVRLDHAVKCLRADTNTDWTLLNLLIAPRYKGDIFSALYSSHERESGVITVNIGNIVNMEPDDLLFDSSSLVYFGLGSIKQAEE